MLFVIGFRHVIDDYENGYAELFRNESHLALCSLQTMFMDSNLKNKRALRVMGVMCLATPVIVR